MKRLVGAGVVLLLIGLMSCPQSPKTVNDTVVARLAFTSPVRVPPATEASRASAPSRIEMFEVTAYSPTVEECDASPTITASGKRVYVGGIAADLNVLPFGSIVIIPGYNNNEPCVVIDTGGAIRGYKLDVFFWSTKEASNWGRRKNVQVRILYVPKEVK